MNIWIQQSIKQPQNPVFDEQKSASTLCLTSGIKRIAILNKARKVASEAYSALDQAKNMRKALFIEAKRLKWLEIMSDLDRMLVDNEINIDEIIIPSSLLNKENQLELPEYESKSLRNADFYFDMDTKINHKRIESICFNLQKQKLTGIVLHNEKFSKADIELAHKFGLTTVITDIRFEHEKETVLSTKTDSVMYCLT